MSASPACTPRMTLFGIRSPIQVMLRVMPRTKKSTPMTMPDATISPPEIPPAMATAPIAFIGSIGIGRR